MRDYPIGHHNRAYTHFVVAGGRILSGWEYAEDARDAKLDSPSTFGPLRVLTRTGCKRIGLDPALASSWA